MATLDFDEQDGQTRLDPDEKAGLIPDYLETRGQLNDWEQENILQATRWLSRLRAPDVLSEGFCRLLHQRMFDETWAWAGTFRKSDKNIGADWRQIATRLNQLLGNVRHQVDSMAFPPDELVARFHRDLVWLHPFPNGNGRHSRMMADALLTQMGGRPFSWGRGATAVGASELRAQYLAALRAADDNDFAALLAFVRS
ncbi:mobile mystery protein B [Variovorax sp. OV329]|uniref:mobile mystery protein B n=1 Tax=Variovorax sp. OV329 TaxID=1882825 RepID=UPI000A59F8FE|nr:mobile mystery protein B [Variovorax sp. OV329]